jgi:hypothetical protein
LARTRGIINSGPGSSSISLGQNKDRSIFRKNIGRALLNRDSDPYLEHWEIDLTTSEAKKKYGPTMERNKQSAAERMVTEVIQKSFHFVAFRVDEKDERLDLESKIISTISRCEDG